MPRPRSRTTRPRDAIGPVARGVAALLLVASLFMVWRLPGGFVVSLWDDPGVHPRIDLGLPNENGWERWRALDIALAVLACALLVTTIVRHRALAAAVGCGALATGAYVLLTAFGRPQRTDLFVQTSSGLQMRAGPGPYLALAALGLAVLALIPLLRAPRAPTL